MKTPEQRKILSQKSSEWNRNNRARFNENKRKDHLKHKKARNVTRTNKYHTPKGIWGTLRSFCKTGQRKCPFSISCEDFIIWYESSAKNCFYCDIPESLAILLPKFNRSGQFKRLSIDKINPEIGYSVGNLVLACYLCNAVKQNVLTIEQMREVGQRFIKPIWLK